MKIAVVKHYFIRNDKDEIEEIDSMEVEHLLKTKNGVKLEEVLDGETADDVLLQDYVVKVTSVDYCVEAQDFPEIEDDDEVERKIAETKASLPQEMIFEIEALPEDLEDIIADTISRETFWLINGFTYDILERRAQQ